MGGTIASGAISIIPPNNPVNAVSTTSDAAGVTVYTVPTGKTFYCTGLTIQSSEAGTVSYSIYVNGVEKMQFGAEQDTLYALAGQPIFYATTAQTIKIVSAIARSVRLNIWGFYL